MASIIYTGEDIERLKGIFPEYEVIDISEKDLLKKTPEVITELENAGLMIIDVHVKKAIKIMQAVSSMDRSISLVVLKDPLEIENFKVAIQFTPFIGNNFKIFSSAQKHKLSEIVNDLADQTKQRRSYQQLISATKKMSLIEKAPDLHIAYLDRFLDEAPVGAILLDEQNEIQALNKYAQELLMINEKDAHKASIYQFFMSNELDNITQLLSDNIKAENSRIFNGKYVKATISEIIGDQKYKILILYDITQRVKVEQELHNKMEELERSNRELEQFAYIVSHDLKNPIGSMMLTSDLAEDETDMQQMKDHINRLGRSSKQLMDIVKGLEEIIDVQKNVDAHVREVRFEEVFKSVIYDHEQQVKEINAKIKTDFSEAPSITYIQAYINSIFSNLISNSIKYRRENVPLVLEIFTKRTNGKISLHFKDNGIGMNLDHHKDEIFKPFRRFTEQATGKGIGLSIIRQMISRNGGEIKVKSTEGAGTEFICHLKPYN